MAAMLQGSIDSLQSCLEYNTSQSASFRAPSELCNWMFHLHPQIAPLPPELERLSKIKPIVWYSSAIGKGTVRFKRQSILKPTVWLPKRQPAPLDIHSGSTSQDRRSAVKTKSASIAAFHIALAFVALWNQPHLFWKNWKAPAQHRSSPHQMAHKPNSKDRELPFTG